MFFVKTFLKLSIINFDKPSAVFKAIFPVNPSVTITSAFPYVIWSGSIYPIKLFLRKLLLIRIDAS